MKASEGKLGRVFLVNLEEGDRPAEVIERFAAEHGIHAAQIMLIGNAAMNVGVLTPDADGKPGLKLAAAAGQDDWNGAQVVIQEMLGMAFRRVRDDAGRETLFKVRSKTRVMEKPAPAPEESGSGTIPVYLFNAEFN